MLTLESVKHSMSRSRYILGVIVVSLFLGAPTFGPPASPDSEAATSHEGSSLDY